MGGARSSLASSGRRRITPETAWFQIAVIPPEESATSFGTGFFVRQDGLVSASHVYLHGFEAELWTRGLE